MTRPTYPQEEALRQAIYSRGWGLYMGQAFLYLWPQGHPDMEIRVVVQDGLHTEDRLRALRVGLRRIAGRVP